MWTEILKRMNERRRIAVLFQLGTCDCLVNWERIFNSRAEGEHESRRKGTRRKAVIHVNKRDGPQAMVMTRYGAQKYSYGGRNTIEQCK